MNKEIGKALIGVAGGATLLALKPDVSAIINAGSSLLSLGLELTQLLATKSPESKRALARIRRRVGNDFTAWSQTEGIDVAAEISAADASLASALPKIFLVRDSLASAAFEPVGFVRAGTMMIVAELARTDALFQERPNNIARRYADVVITSALRAILDERRYFELLQPHLTLQLAQIVGEIDRKVTRVLASAEAADATGGLSRAELQSLLKAFFEEQVPEEAARGLLLEKAKELHALRARLSDIELADTTLRRGLSQVTSAIGKGRYAEADAILSRLIEEGGSSALRSLSTNVELLYRRADLAHAQTKYHSAAEIYGRAAAVAMSFNARAAWFLLGRQARSLMEHALRTSGTTDFESAVAIAFKRIALAASNDADRAESVGLFTTVVGLYAQRAEYFRASGAISTALELVRDILEKLDPLNDGRLIAQVANTFGALLNSALSIGIVDAQKDMRDQAVERLTQACALAMTHVPAALPHIRQNLATALRRKAEKASEPGSFLREAIENRVLAIAETDSNEVHDLSNLYESLGNDYQAFARAQGKPDRQIFLQSLTAHRRALRLRRKASYPIDIAQSRFNIGRLYEDTAVRLTGKARTRLLRLAKRHFERGLNSISQAGSPKLWLQLAHRWSFTSIYLLDLGEDMDDSALRTLGDEILSLMNFAHTTGHIPMLMEGAQLSYGLSTHIHETRRCALADVPRAQVSAFKDLLRSYRYVPGIGNDLELWAATSEFIVGDLTDDTGIATNARQRAARVADTLTTDDSDDLSADVKQVLEHMDGKLDALLQRVAM